MDAAPAHQAAVPDGEHAAQMGSLPEHLLAGIIARSLGHPSVSRAFHRLFLTVFSCSDLCVEWALEKCDGSHRAAYEWLVQQQSHLQPPASIHACASLLVRCAPAGRLDLLLFAAATYRHTATMLELLAAGADVHAHQDIALVAAAWVGQCQRC